MQIYSTQFILDSTYSYASWQQFISRTLANWALNGNVHFVIIRFIGLWNSN